MQQEPNKTPVVPVDLGKKGISYVKSRLEKAGDLSTLVNTLFGAEGEAFAPLPQGADLQRAERFEHGSHLPTGDIRKWLADHIGALSADKGYQLVFEDVWMQQKDMERHKKPGMFFHNSKVYYLMSGEDIAALLAAGITAVSSFFLTGFVVSPPVKTQPDREEVDDAFISALARNVREVFVSAYDQEGFVVWKR